MCQRVPEQPTLERHPGRSLALPNTSIRIQSATTFYLDNEQYRAASLFIGTLYH